MSPTDAPPHRQREASPEERARPAGHAVRSARGPLLPGARPGSEATDSWIEVSSQPSSASLSSVAPDEIITEGLRVQHDSNTRRRRRFRTTGSLHLGGGLHNTSTGASSQEEYEESESESDRIMSSSNEGIRASLLRNQLHQYELRNSTASSEEASAGEYDDDDENSTAVNYPRNTPFHPQPNAFTHGPHTRPRVARTGSYSSTGPNVRGSTAQRHSYASGQQHSPYNVISPSYRADHDEVLRASLNTLLSLGAAARGLPKSGQQIHTAPAQPSSRIEPSSIRMVPESVALGGTRTPSDQPSSHPSQDYPPSSRDSPLGYDKGKRKSSPTPRSGSKDRHNIKKVKRTSMEDISPTLFTWVMSAGVMVLFSAISFSAGYMVGKEAGRAEVIGQVGGTAVDAGRCGREAGAGMRRLKWSGVANAATGVRV